MAILRGVRGGFGRAVLIRRLRPVGAYGAVAMLTVGLFIGLHVAGNRLPVDLAIERLAEEFRAAPGRDWGNREQQWGTRTHYCRLGGLVLAESSSSDTLRDALFGRGGRGATCQTLQAAVQQGVLAFSFHRGSRHWHGGKAIYAIALRHMTVRQFHMAIEALVYCGFLALAAALFLIGWRSLVVGAPLLMFGLWCSGVEYFGTMATGLPFAWALFAPALGVLLLRRGPASAARLFFFFAGMVSHYFWLFGGNNFFAATLIGLVAWLARESAPPRQRALGAAACVGVYTAGFVVSLVSRLGISAFITDWRPVFAARYSYLLERILEHPLARDMDGRAVSTYQHLVRMDAPTFEWWALAAVAAMLAAALMAGRHAWRRKPAPLFDLLWFAAMFLPSGLHFFLTSDNPPRVARLMFLPLGLACCCLLAVLTRLPRRQGAAWIVGIGAALAFSYGGAHLASWRKYEADLARAQVLSASQENGAFAVYLRSAVAEDVKARKPFPVASGGGSGEGRTDAPDRVLIYRKSPCGTKDMRHAGFLQILAPSGSLPEDHWRWSHEMLPPTGSPWRQHGVVNTDFTFYGNGQVLLGTCYASVRLPSHAKAIRTGQTKFGGRHIWRTTVIDLPAAAGAGPVHAPDLPPPVVAP